MKRNKSRSANRRATDRKSPFFAATDRDSAAGGQGSMGEAFIGRNHNAVIRNSVTTDPIIQRAWDAAKCPDGVPHGITVNQVLNGIDGPPSAFSVWQGQPGKRWSATAGGAFRVLVTDGTGQRWLVTLIAHVHVYPENRSGHELAPGSMYIPGFAGWGQRLSSAVFSLFPPYSPEQYAIGYENGLWTELFKGNNRYPKRTTQGLAVG